MIRMNEALSWINQFENSHLRRTTQALVKHITNLQTPEDKRRQMINSAIKHSRNHIDRLELPELLLNICEVKFRQQSYTTARDYANAAVQLFPANSHRLAVARWILGITAWELPDYKLGYSSWYYAREIFEKLEERSTAQNHEDMAKWYQNVLVSVNVDMVCTAEEIYTWLDHFEPSHLSNAARQLNETLTEKLEKNQFQDVYKLIDDLQTLGRSSTDLLENAEILVECTLALYRMGNLNEAVRMMQKAIDAFTPQSHHQAVARWMLGILLWETTDKNPVAIMHWEKCLENFDELAHRADQANKQMRVSWYRKKRAIMARALSEKISEKLA